MALLPKNQRDQVMVLLVIVAVALIGLYYAYVYSPKSDVLADLQAHVDSLDVSNQRAKAELAKGNVEQLRAEAAKLQASLEVMRQLVPTSNEVPALLEQVSTAARRVGLDLATVKPQPVIEGEQFDTYRYQVTVIGDYHALGEFLTNVGSLTRIIAPVNLALAPLGNGAALDQRRKAQKNNSSVLDSRFEIQTYVAKTAPPRPAPAGGSKS
ncbi:MAG TPA: type 4a pilus biogenesis protein PilO [Gemmatimonadaceae bacterium]|jgi:type IV pilus assembly protein PilO|nr:type 4a pilus biogenesis protein PilO [Gemmatimonadaceae bacterium]